MKKILIMTMVLVLVGCASSSGTKLEKSPCACTGEVVTHAG